MQCVPITPFNIHSTVNILIVGPKGSGKTTFASLLSRTHFKPNECTTQYSTFDFIDIPKSNKINMSTENFPNINLSHNINITYQYFQLYK